MKTMNWIICGICLVTFWVTMIFSILEFGWLEAALMLCGECAVTILSAAMLYDGKEDRNDEAGTHR